MKMIFGGYVVGKDSCRNQLPVKADPDDVTVEKAVTGIAEGIGVLEMRCDPAPELGPCELVLYAESGQFLLMLNEVTADGDSDVRTLSNNSAKNELVSILGEKYPAKAVTQDLGLVCSIFREFAHTGTVSGDVLN